VISKKLHRQIRYLVEKVRKAVEQLACDEDELLDDNMNCSKTLGGYCARASAMLSYELSKRGIPYKIIHSDWGHIHIQCHGYILDATATQFGNLPKVMMRKVGALEFICVPREVDMKWWQKSNIFKTVEALSNWQCRKDWPLEQSVNYDDLEYL